MEDTNPLAFRFFPNEAALEGFLQASRESVRAGRGNRIPQQAPDGSASVKWMFPHEYAAKENWAFSVVALVSLS